MHLWFQAIILFAVTGFSKAQHFIHFVILGALGLMGLWILHMLAQDIDKVFNKPASRPPKLFWKRSIGDVDYFANRTVENVGASGETNISVDWNRILTNDPIGCVRSFACQLAAEDSKRSSTNKGNINQLFWSAKRKGWAGDEIRFALNYGTNSKKVEKCRAFYKYCPFSIDTMRDILKFFGAT
ncbi:hypothetical protein PPYR_11409 [Photinus pyralis]|uniref:Uncharacterized protein n=2 Tax=Photinus pyralis TaxID=7054 RepID=A0A5N4AB64_PHOPY|nr:uncharacterized protein LOC116176327 [Photinus pyralis]XP_031350691.1 uncharacterized protein LOC116176327 [Photinus pyralis]XP_031350692.1 uncharacterized protein LOC116176327 [Photinus pyralis]XP_031350694.1 uncharacterized protein LOC116176327 [Photinus pyralis]XP_031350695.1 uncharacterized protein LOC116176327 [Photinus pyralis]XP_031351757.1 uncharacterized protein LOC116177038 [Photinus pyralis]KAB0794319.1 hypothetical protein PPYR_11158 [Photinus pyralis]KAB0794570.1 hypothetical